MIVDFDQFEVIRQRLSNLLDAPFNTIRYLYGIRVAFFIDRELNRLRPINPRNRLALFVAASNGRNVAEIDGPISDVRDDRCRKFVDALKFVNGTNEESLVAFLETPAREIHVFGADALRDLLNADAEL